MMVYHFWGNYIMKHCSFCVELFLSLIIHCGRDQLPCHKDTPATWGKVRAARYWGFQPMASKEMRPVSHHLGEFGSRHHPLPPTPVEPSDDYNSIQQLDCNPWGTLSQSHLAKPITDSRPTETTDNKCILFWAASFGGNLLCHKIGLKQSWNGSLGETVEGLTAILIHFSARYPWNFWSGK